MFQGRFGSDNVVFDTDLLRRIKYEKSPVELGLIGQANAVADAAFLGMLAVLEPGIRELDVAAVGDYIMKRLGARTDRISNDRVFRDRGAGACLGPGDQPGYQEGGICLPRPQPDL